ncbi:hypothetical protein [Xanthomonas phage XAJ2]|uniref:Uncharacterized protein n=1 Tax=Xanthomonas phage XAJ2 TaxID=1775249 RepID=A0A1I9L2I5_9CAUD|nr:hypothetical protein [Xanthomonas phage XAJ2]
MKVSQLIEQLQKMPQDLHVIMSSHSEYVIVDAVSITEACEARHDDWVPRSRPDRPTCDYVEIL